MSAVWASINEHAHACMGTCMLQNFSAEQSSVKYRSKHSPKFCNLAAISTQSVSLSQKRYIFLMQRRSNESVSFRAGCTHLFWMKSFHSKKSTFRSQRLDTSSYNHYLSWKSESECSTSFCSFLTERKWGIHFRSFRYRHYQVSTDSWWKIQKNSWKKVVPYMKESIMEQSDSLL